MAAFQILVQAAELIMAANEMNQAMEIYRDAVESAKSAAADLASKWEGASRDQFVLHQEEAYNWHNEIIAVVIGLIALVREAIRSYETMEDRVKNAIKG